MKLLEKFADFVADVFDDLWKLVFSFTHALQRSILENGGDVLVEAAMDAVTAAERVQGGGDAKRGAAFDRVVSVLIAKGIPVVVHAVNGAIEAAVAQHKLEQAREAAEAAKT